MRDAMDGRWLRRGAALMSAGLLSICLIACDNPEAASRREASERIEEATAILHKLASDRAMTIAPDKARAEFERVLATVQSPMGQPEQRAAMQALAAEAGMGLARLDLAAAMEVDHDFDNRMIETSRKLDLLLATRATLEGVEAVDLAPALEEIDRQEQSSQARRSTLEREAASIQTRLDDLQRQIDAELSEYNRLREESAMLRERAREAPLEQRRSMIERAAEISRQADAHQVAAANLEARLDLVEPELTRARNEIARTETELAALAQSRQAISQRREQLSAEAASLNETIQRLRGELDAELSALAAERETTLAPLFAAAAEDAQEAVAQAEAASSRAPGGAERLALANQLLGHVHWQQARSLGRFGALISRAAEQSDVLRRGDQDGELAAELQNRAEQQKRAAEAAYLAAIDAAAGADESESLVAKLNDSLALMRGEAVTDEDFMDEGGASAPEGDTAAVPAGPSPAETLREAYNLVQSGRFSGLTNLFYSDTPDGQAHIDQMRPLLTSLEGLDQAARSAYGHGLVEILANPDVQAALNNTLSAFMGGMAPGMTEFAPPSPEEFDAALAEIGFEYDSAGTTAWADDPEWSMLTFRQVDGQWKFDLSDAGAMPEGMEGSPELEAMSAATLEALVQAVDATARGVTEGQYGDEVSMVSGLMADLMNRMNRIMLEMQNQSGGGG